MRGASLSHCVSIQTFLVALLKPNILNLELSENTTGLEISLTYPQFIQYTYRKRAVYEKPQECCEQGAMKRDVGKCRYSQRKYDMRSIFDNVRIRSTLISNHKTLSRQEH